MPKIKKLRAKLEQYKGVRSEIERNIVKTEKQLKTAEKSLIYHEQAKEIIKQIGLQTQKQLQYHISDITSLALESVFPDAYALQAEFVERRDKTECDLFFVRGDEKVNPLMASGGGAVDVASFALRIASWSMKHPKSSNTIILDEPFRFLSRNYHTKASQMLKELSDKLGIQFIIVTHEPVLADSADTSFRVFIEKGVSKVEKL